MKCKICMYWRFNCEGIESRGCSIWSEFKLGIRRLPLGTNCPSCGDNDAVSPSEFMNEIGKIGPKGFTLGPCIMGNIIRYGSVLVHQDSKCAFFKDILT